MSVLLSSDNAELIVTCGCECEDAIHMRLNVEDEDDEIMAISYMNSNFYRDQVGALKAIIKKIKKIWRIIRGKDICYSEIIMTKEEFAQFRKYVNSIEV